MAKKPPVTELDFLKISGNHLEYSRKLAQLACPSSDIYEYAQNICECWFRLAEEHLAESKTLLTVGCIRAVYSKAYYAAYNASKAARYIRSGFVSLKGDDHAAASTALPGDLPDVATWASKISSLYEHRLYADYDNWDGTAARMTLPPAAAINDAESFINVVRTYLNSTSGTTL